MTIDIFNFDGTQLTTVNDGTIQDGISQPRHATINLVGRGYKRWGKPMQENLLWIMQNFAGTTIPSNPIKGQMWYDTNTGANVIKIYNGTEWVSNGTVYQPTRPISGANNGALWFDNVNMQMYSWDGSNWDLIGPLGSLVNTDPFLTNQALPGNSAITAMRVRDISNAIHQIWLISVGGTLLAVISKDPAFVPDSTTLISSGFPKIYTGINFNTTIASTGISGNKILQDLLPDTNAAWTIGSTSARMANVHTVGATVSGNLSVTGTAIFGPSTTSVAAAKWVPGALLTTPKVGAVEFTGTSFYFTNLVNGVPTRQQPLFSDSLATSYRLYVSTRGNDTNDGTQANRSFRTIKAALAKAALTVGYTIFVEGGEYYEQNPLYVPPKTSIVGDNLRRTVVHPIHNQLDIFHVDIGTFFFGMTFKGHRAPAFSFAFPCSTATATLTGGAVSAINPLYSQSGYSVAPNVFIEAPPYNAGTQATAQAVLVNGGIVDVVITSPGASYTVSTPPLIVISGSSGSGAVFRGRVNDAGQLVAIDIVDPGQSYEITGPITVTIGDVGGNGYGAQAYATAANGVIRSYTITNAGSGYLHAPHISIKPVNPAFITSSPYVQNCSSITGPFDDTGREIIGVSLPYDDAKLNLNGYGNLDPIGAGAGIRIDGEVLTDTTVIRSFVADSFTQLNQGGIGHLIINKGYAQFVSCFTTFSSVGYWARSGGFANISNSVIDFGDIGLKAEGYYPVPYETGTLSASYTSKVASVTMAAGGSGYNGNFAVTFDGGLGPGGVAASGTAIVTAGVVTSVQVPSGTQGSGYISTPTINWNAGVGGNGANGTVNMLQNETVTISGTTVKPSNSSTMILNGKFYTVISAANNAPGGASSWNVNIYPPLLAGNSGDAVAFHDISNISSGGLALEYVGSGVTYNALPRYGGVPDVLKQVVDSDSDENLKPGRVFYVTIDNTGNFKIGKFFAVNFADGSVSINSSSFNLTGLSAIGPFKRSGYAVGTYTDEISDDPALTHSSNANYDHTTVTTQYAVRKYLQQMSTNLLPNINASYDIGSSSYKWRNQYLSGDSSIGGTLNLYGGAGGDQLIMHNGGDLVLKNAADTGSARLYCDTDGRLNLTGSFVASSGLTVTAGGATVTAGGLTVSAGGLTVSAGGLTVSAGGATVSAGGLTVSAGGLTVSNTGGANISGTIKTDTISASTTYTGRPLNVRGEISLISYDDGSPPNQSAYINVHDVNANNGTSKALVIRGLDTAGGAEVQLSAVYFRSTNTYFSGDLIAFSNSDSSLKTNIEKIPNALDKVSKLNGYTFNWNEKSGKDQTAREAGVIAQEVEAVLPEVVTTRDDGTKAVRYEKLVPLLIEAINDLRAELEILKNK